jgi:hypothetical protein
MSDQNDDSQIDDQLEKLSDEAGTLIEQAKYRSSFRLFGELRQRAKRERRLYHYVLGTFHQMDQAQYLFEFQTMRERAIELIALLESEEQCRKIQPDMPLQLFEGLAYQFSSCAYENLAEATGQMEGYNSEGLQACISDGLQICRQTGKLSCVGCFREYSCDVYMAADDSEIAQHQCNLVLDDSTPLSSRGDRRWLARKKIAWMTFLEGRTQTAIEMYRDALILTEREEVTLKLEAQLRTLYELDSLLILTGQPEELPLHAAFAMQPPEGECLAFDMDQALNRSLRAALQQDWGSAIEPLLEWDRLLQERNGTHLWLEVRLRLIAIKLLAGEQRQADRLAEQLQQRASTANDWLTLRRLTALQDPDLPTSPLAPYAREIVATPTTSDGVATFSYMKTEDEAVDDGSLVTPHRQRLLEIGAMFEAIQEESVSEDLARIRQAIRSIDTTTVDHDTDACALLHMMGYAMGEGEEAPEIWAWANQLSKNFQENPAVLSMLGDLGNRLRFGPNEEFGATITSDRLEPLFRKAIQLKDAKSGTFMRAGDHFMSEQNLGEAERCYARSFRLKRNLGEVAIKLASLYRETDRLRDALHVLDVCLREGADIPQVAWEAGLTAFTLKRYEIMLTYLDRYKAAVGDQLWIDYYRATGLLERGEPAAALEAINHEQELVGEPALHLAIIRGCAFAALGEAGAAQAEFEAALATPLATVDYLSAPGITALLIRALEASQKHLADTAFATRFEDRLLESYLAPEELFQAIRERQPPANVTFYQILVRQPLDENWMTFQGRLAHEDEADSYLGSWGVLAEDDDAAQKMVLQWQRRCYPLDAEVVEISGNDETFSESSGIVWQGQRMFAGDEDMEGFDGDFDGNDFEDPDFDDDDELREFEDD